MLIWKGWGISAFIIPLICSLLMQLFINSNFGDGYYTAASWPLPLALLLSSIPVFILGQKLNKKPGRIVVDLETNEKIELKTTHSLFWVPMQYWSLVTIAVSVWMYLSNTGVIYQ
jgi:hypothetical protein